jgi:protein-tyrosine-phosphatase
LANYEVDFGGLCESKQPVSKRAIQAMQERGIDMSGCGDRMEIWADIILALNVKVFDQLINAYPVICPKLHTIQEYANEKQGLVFPEPCGDKAFDDAVKKIDVITDKLAEKINGQFEVK